MVFEGKQFVISVLIVLKRHYPGFNQLLDCIPDHRKKKTYEVSEIIMAGLYMFIFKRGSRNNADKGVAGNFENNYIKLFGLRLPIMDTVNIFMEKLSPGELEKLKQILVKRLVEKRVLEKYRFMERYIVGIDGTGIYSFDYEPFPGCPYKTSKNGKTTWQAYVLEAKILCGNGFSISLATEWLCNSDNMNEKQDCELKAFTRLAQKIKRMYPRLPIIIAADALYPNQTVFNICKSNNWRFILTFKEGTLKTVWEEINLLLPLNTKENKQEKIICKDKQGWLHETVIFLNNIEYRGTCLDWVEYTRSYKGSGQYNERFVHVTDIKIKKENAFDISFNGRLRWKIENEGFNSQKNDGYKMQHKYSRTNLNAMQNYYQLLQISHLIVQLTEKLKKVKEAVAVSGRTLKSVWEDMIATMLKESLSEQELALAVDSTKQLRY